MRHFFWSFLSVSLLVGSIPSFAALSVGAKLCRDAVQEKARGSELVDRRSESYVLARDFTHKFGVRFARFVEDAVLEEGRTDIVIALGGAEHLGTLLEGYFARRPQLNVRLHFLYLTEKILGIHKVRGNSGERPTYRVELGRNGWRRLAHAGPRPQDQARAYLEQHRVFDGDKLIVVDTGFLGSVPEAVGQIAQSAGYRGEVEGVLLYQSTIPLVSRTIPVFGFNHVVNEEEVSSLESFTYLMDEGADLSDPVTKMLYFDGDLLRGLPFAKSRKSPSRLVQIDGIWMPEGSLDEGPSLTQSYLDTVQGIDDVLNAYFRPQIIRPARVMIGRPPG